MYRSGAIKRFTDVAVASAALIILSPFMVGIALALRLDQGSPILFRQVRPGLHGVPFTIYKYRTMDTIEMTYTASEVPTDLQRTTRLGRLLRSLSPSSFSTPWGILPRLIRNM